MKQIIVIPARMKGTRLPGKPLISIAGKPMIQHVFERCADVHDISQIYVATEDDLIVEFCNQNDIPCINTGFAVTAIDRLKLFSDIIPADSYINVQGDEPVVNPQDILKILNYNKEFPDRIVFGKTIASEQDFNDYSKAKVVCALDGKLLYSSRAGIPINKKGEYVSAERAIWIYAFNKKALDSYFESINDTKLDKIEDNEIIRFLEIGLNVYCIDVNGNSWAVDEEKDLLVVEKLINKSINNV